MLERVPFIGVNLLLVRRLPQLLQLQLMLLLHCNHKLSHLQHQLVMNLLLLLIHPMLILHPLTPMDNNVTIHHTPVVDVTDTAWTWCMKAIHCFCAVNKEQELGHGAHYWCKACHADKIVENSWKPLQWNKAANAGPFYVPIADNPCSVLKASRIMQHSKTAEAAHGRRRIIIMNSKWSPGSSHATITVLLLLLLLLLLQLLLRMCYCH